MARELGHTIVPIRPSLVPLHELLEGVLVASFGQFDEGTVLIGV